MTDQSQNNDKPNIDSDHRTVIGLKGSEQHHDLKNKSGDGAKSDTQSGTGKADK